MKYILPIILAFSFAAPAFAWEPNDFKWQLLREPIANEKHEVYTVAFLDSRKDCVIFRKLMEKAYAGHDLVLWCEKGDY